VVSWNDAAEMNDCVVRLAFVIPRRSGSAVAGCSFFFLARSPVTRHHAAGGRVSLAAPIELPPVEREAMSSCRGIEHELSGGNDFFPDAVTGMTAMR
jgi:hypothetical protein